MREDRLTQTNQAGLPSLGAVLTLARPYTLLAPVVGVACAAGVAAGALGVPFPILWIGAAALSAALATAASNAWNQVFDLEVDRINRADRPIPSGRLRPGTGMVIGDLWALGAVLVAAVVSPYFLACVAVGLLFTWAYSAPPLRLKRRLVGALAAISLPRGLLVPVAGWSAVAPPERADPWALGAVCGLYVFGAAAVKDFGDVRGDAKTGCRTLPVVLGPRVAARVVAPFLVFPFLLYPLFAWVGWLAPPVERFAVLAAGLMGVGAITARALLRSAEAPPGSARWVAVWRGMYLLLLAAYVGTLLVYL